MSDPQDPTNWLDVRAAAAHLACTPKRIYNLVGEGRLRAARDGRRLLFRAEWLDAIVVEHARGVEANSSASARNVSVQ